MIAGNLSIMLGTKGPNLAIVTACTTPRIASAKRRNRSATGMPTS
jgi:3-oxoacyl-(acyl-carrier-protein) synthase